MKGIKAIVFAGVFVIITSIVCFTGKNQVYEKKIHYNSPEEIINVLNTKALTAYTGSDNRYYNNVINTDDFLECMSKRKRTVNLLSEFSRLNLTIDEDFNEEAIINEYLANIKNLDNYQPGKNLRGYSLSGTYTTYYNNSGNIQAKIVFCDEGEGYVIDYIVNSFNEDITSDINK